MFLLELKSRPAEQKVKLLNEWLSFQGGLNPESMESVFTLQKEMTLAQLLHEKGWKWQLHSPCAHSGSPVTAWPGCSATTPAAAAHRTASSCWMQRCWQRNIFNKKSDKFKLLHTSKLLTSRKELTVVCFFAFFHLPSCLLIPFSEEQLKHAVVSLGCTQNQPHCLSQSSSLLCSVCCASGCVYLRPLTLWPHRYHSDIHIQGQRVIYGSISNACGLGGKPPSHPGATQSTEVALVLVSLNRYGYSKHNCQPSTAFCFGSKATSITDGKKWGEHRVSAPFACISHARHHEDNFGADVATSPSSCTRAQAHICAWGLAVFNLGAPLGSTDGNVSSGAHRAASGEQEGFLQQTVPRTAHHLMPVLGGVLSACRTGFRSTLFNSRSLKRC